ncbi:tripartite tricarboxylate transporter substrate binding protein [Azospirillum sp. SYSU D00513]|uniref:Bug family tripartite tricarboxylate transporter substrate binding protein n=1 Tax=Azospirillum sp. SYSU D00513 TaxID=2812561 RepID=UPI001A96DB01|nr:tripartite tricarboxylate transporter substrate binding protein [Azospirillum sp. SYSU D00513]
MKTLKLLGAVCLGLALASPAQAAFPEKPITMIVPFPAGGASDNTARIIGQKMAETLGQPVVVENRPGATGAIGATLVAQAKPDGYTLLVASIGTYSIIPYLQPGLKYDPTKDFDPLTVAVRTPNVLVTNPNFPANSVAEFLDYLKKNPDKVTFASSGAGSSDHLTAALFWQKTGTTGLHVPYKGGAPAISDLIGGHADASFQNQGSVATQIKAGKLKLLGVTADKRTETFPDTPTMAEAGIKDMAVYSWQAVAAPKGLPADVKSKLSDALSKALNDAEVQARFKDMGFEVVNNTSAEFADFLAKENARWKQVVQTGNITAE